MRSLHILFLLGWAFLAATCEAAVFNPDLEIYEARRTIDLRSMGHSEVINFSLVNVNQEPADKFFVTLPADRADKLAYFLTRITTKGQEQILDPVEITTLEGVEVPEGTKIFELSIPTLAFKESFSLTSVISYQGLQRPLPAEIEQGEDQFMEYIDSLYIFTPHTVKIQSTVVALASETIEAYTDTDSSITKNEITYGDFKDMPAFSHEELYVHFENNMPFSTMTKAFKEIEISHWGNIAVEEHYDLFHSGAKLKGGFSRLDWEQSSLAKARSGTRDSAYRTLIGRLPPSATNTYYRDQIGNVSTSNVRDEGDRLRIEVAPRYPMMGGWKTDMYIGYNVPASEFLQIDNSDSTHYILDVPFSIAFPAVEIQEYEVRVIFPEGTTDIEWLAPYDIDAEEHDFRVTYLDTSGRPVLILKKSLVGMLHSHNFKVSYHFGTFSILNEPFLLMCVFMSFFVLVMLYVRTNFTISSNRETEEEEEEKAAKPSTEGKKDQ